MKIELKRNEISDNPYSFLRKAGYGFIRDRRSGSESLVRRLGGGFYPRFHIYIEEDSENISFNLHLDHKEDGHAGNRRHNAEYSGETVKREIDRLKYLIKNSQKVREAQAEVKEEKKKGWFRGIFS